MNNNGHVGAGWTSIAVDGDNQPHISYQTHHYNTTDLFDRNLHYTYKKNNIWVSEIVDSDNKVGQYNSIAIDSNNHPHISYSGPNIWGSPIRYAHRVGNEWKIELIETEEYLDYTSISLDTNDNPHICASRGTEIAYITRDDNSWYIEYLPHYKDNADYRQPDIVLDDYKKPHIVCYSYSNNVVMYAGWTGSKWNIFPDRVNQIVATGQLPPILGKRIWVTQNQTPGEILMVDRMNYGVLAERQPLMVETDRDIIHQMQTAVFTQRYGCGIMNNDGAAKITGLSESLTGA